ncbi:MAG TPA: DUF4349 domain-containing protein [Bdellovibrionota bacterium]|nr:DUF4349 domain-containing protein [Bdellovibrionota bacterium]
MIRSIASALALLFVFSACSTAPQRAAESDLVSVAPSGETKGDRMLIKRGEIRIEVETVAFASGKVEAIVKRMGGHVFSAREEDEGARIQIRVPAQRLDESLDELSKLGDEQSRKVTSEDVTEGVLDLEARLKNAIALRDRLRELLRQTKDMKETLELEQQLARTQTDVDSLESRLKQLRTDVALSSVEVELKRRVRLGPIGWVGAKVGWLVTKLFVIE